METYDFSRPTHYCSGVFLIDKQRILLLKQSRSPFWMLPGGHIEDSELPHEAAIREVEEETGLKVELLEKADEKARTKIATPLPLPHHIQMLPCRDKRDVNMAYVARLIGGKLTVSDESEQAKWFSKEEMLKDPTVGPSTRYYALMILDEYPNV